MRAIQLFIAVETPSMPLQLIRLAHPSIFLPSAVTDTILPKPKSPTCHGDSLLMPLLIGLTPSSSTSYPVPSTHIIVAMVLGCHFLLIWAAQMIGRRGCSTHKVLALYNIPTEEEMEGVESDEDEDEDEVKNMMNEDE
jgi:hypothetical protein